MPFNRPKFRAHVKAHKTVIGNERWLRKGSPFLGKPFTVKKTLQRHHQVIGIPRRAENAGNDALAGAMQRLADKLMELLSNYTSCVGRCTRADELISSNEYWAGCHDK